MDDWFFVQKTPPGWGDYPNQIDRRCYPNSRGRGVHTWGSTPDHQGEPRVVAEWVLVKAQGSFFDADIKTGGELRFFPPSVKKTKSADDRLVPDDKKVVEDGHYMWFKCLGRDIRSESIYRERRMVDGRCRVTGRLAPERGEVRGQDWTALHCAHAIPLAWSDKPHLEQMFSAEALEVVENLHQKKDLLDNTILMDVRAHVWFDDYRFGIWPFLAAAAPAEVPLPPYGQRETSVQREAREQDEKRRAEDQTKYDLTNVPVLRELLKGWDGTSSVEIEKNPKSDLAEVVFIPTNHQRPSSIGDWPSFFPSAQVPSSPYKPGNTIVNVKGVNTSTTMDSNHAQAEPQWWLHSLINPKGYLPYLAPSLSLYLVPALIRLCHSIFSWISVRFSPAICVTGRFPEGDPAYKWILLLLISKTNATEFSVSGRGINSRRKWEAKNGSAEYTPMYDTPSMFHWRGHLVEIKRNRNEVATTGSHSLSSLQLTPDWMLTDNAGIRIFTRDTKLLDELVKEAQDQFAKANQPYVVVHLADVGPPSAQDIKGIPFPQEIPPQFHPWTLKSLVWEIILTHFQPSMAPPC
ncbi:hypothetical protein B0H14DRAFT_3135641 [Mycena olivaceomarginata]|nr:hypothetical protein B0H14DRAFT_3135641 [Mycena olivaceomarginata]